MCVCRILIKITYLLTYLLTYLVLRHPMLQRTTDTGSGWSYVSSLVLVECGAVSPVGVVKLHQVEQRSLTVQQPLEVVVQRSVELASVPLASVEIVTCSLRKTHSYYASAPVGWGHIHWWPLSSCPSVCPVPTLSREWKSLARSNLVWRRSRVIRGPI